MPTGLWQRIVEEFAPAKIVEFFATTDGPGRAGERGRVRWAARAGRCPAAARWNWPPMTPMTT